MVALWIMIVLLSLLAATVGALIALRIQYRTLEEGRQERDAWREAQEGRQRTWEVRQAKRNLEVEKQLFNQFKDLRREWQSWQQDWYEQAEQHQQTILARADLEQELARLPHIEDVELPLDAHTPRQQPERWQPPTLYQADLRGRDLSHRYMGQADLRGAQLAGANLYMADLTGAHLMGANLMEANLAGANLCGADLRQANLRGANLLVADLHNALLHGATLQNTCGLVPQQLHTAIYDSATSIDRDIYTALATLPDAQSTQPELPQTLLELAPDLEAIP
ncbi:MAG: pentapeptide repeat-containing protein, partial [Ktedonobacteraceae bacterium]